MEVSKNIRSIREAKGLTQVDVAERLGTERSNYARLESRDVNLTLKQIGEIANALEVSIYDIIGSPERQEVEDDRSERIRYLEDRLGITEEIVRAKQLQIKLYKTFIGWVREVFKLELSIGKIQCAQVLGIAKKLKDDAHDLDEDAYHFSEEDLKRIGELMFDRNSNRYYWSNFIASTGLIEEAWFNDAYKKNIDLAVPSDTLNWAKTILDMLDDE
ncbi:helix-turn-helix domain-containing protein [Telluribacter sp. SYSU D00476]|uniref:helix-turn-helix domain-containing protein n=1 Tax=Telluribacter sp. SYSU D00476 TaxID=2811430 RepID=UPI001FF34427|nr:helix-turn-helix domain-containing protein [Telluribacter sp. SYSU D00476]